MKLTNSLLVFNAVLLIAILIVLLLDFGTGRYIALGRAYVLDSKTGALQHIVYAPHISPRPESEITSLLENIPDKVPETN